MTLYDYLRVLRERWKVLTAGVVIGVVAAGAFAMLRPPEYTAELTMYVSGQDSGTAADEDDQVSAERVNSYVELASSTRISREVIRRLRLDTTPEALQERITASSPTDSLLINVEVTGPSPQRLTAVTNAVGDVFGDLIAGLEGTSRQAQPDVRVQVVEPAFVPATPSSVGLPVMLVLGLLAGVAIGGAAALARNALDTTIKSAEQLRAIARAPCLGTIAYDARAPRRPLTVHENPGAPRSEEFRRLRTNLQFVDLDHPPRVIAVTSSTAGEGKTTTACNLAIALATAGSRVLVVDADLRRAAMAELLGIEGGVGLTSVLAGHAGLHTAIQPWGHGLLDVLASGPLPANPSELLGSDHTRDLLAQLRQQYDAVFMDLPPLLPVADAAAAAPAADGAILICRARHANLARVRSAVEALDAVAVPLLGTVLTMLRPSRSSATPPYGGGHLPSPPVKRTTAYVASPAAARPSNGAHPDPAGHAVGRGDAVGE